jgi:selenoprotein W-related protein
MPQAAGLAAALISGWAPILRSVELVSGTGGIFDVTLDDELVFTKSMIGRYPEPSDVLPMIRERIGPEVL